MLSTATKPNWKPSDIMAVLASPDLEVVAGGLSILWTALEGELRKSALLFHGPDGPPHPDADGRVVVVVGVGRLDCRGCVLLVTVGVADIVEHRCNVEDIAEDLVELTRTGLALDSVSR